MENFALAKSLAKFRAELIDVCEVLPAIADEVVEYARVTARQRAANDDADDRFELVYRTHGSSAAAERYGISRDAARQRFHRIQQRRMERVTKNA